MENPLRVLKKPEYFYNPKQFFKRIAQFVVKPTNGESVITLFGEDFWYLQNDDIGRAIHTFGLYDLCVSEALWLLTERDAVVCDVGANLGYFSCLLSCKVGSNGFVHAFEPNPQVISHLLKNTANRKNINIHSLGLSDSDTQMSLYAPHSYDGNRGLASLNETSGEIIASVKIVKLDNLNLKPTILKMDIEGHELNALRGSEKTLEHVQHIVFEDHDLEANGVKDFLLQKGFEIYYLEKNFSFLRLKSISSKYSISRSEPPNFLATKWGKNRLDKLFLQNHWSFIKALSS